MQRFQTQERPGWRERAREFGFQFHTMYGEPYWDESIYYQFSLRQIEDDIEDVTEALHEMCLAAVEKVVKDEYWMQRFCIPERHWDWLRDSWLQREPSLYSRLDLAYNGYGPAKLLENNADTPTSLYESGFWQWLWLEDKIQQGEFNADTDQFNSLQDQLVERFRCLQQKRPEQILHFSCCKDSVEDRGTVQYLEDCASEAGIETQFVFIEDIGLGENGLFTDMNDQVIAWMFKLYPWEFMLREEFSEHLEPAAVSWLEPPWKALLSNKALLPLLWQLFPNHPNLLPAYFEGDKGLAELNHFVKKPIFAREGANISIHKDGEEVEASAGPYGEEGFVYQAYTPLPEFDGQHTLVGSWLVNDRPAGISVREDHQRITQDLSRYIPHVIVD